MRNICSNMEEFFKVVASVFRNSDEVLALPRDQWESVISRYVQLLAYKSVNRKRLNVKVDFENADDRSNWKEEEELTDEAFVELTRNGLMGFHSLDSGAIFFAFHCGGDWEEQVNAILYVEDGQLKVYIPEKGNIFNAEYMAAYGNHNDNEEYKGKMCDQNAELQDIADYFENRKEFEHADGSVF